MKIKTLKIYGLEELVEMTTSMEDSYDMHIEDPENLETAPYSFVVGEKDYRKIMWDAQLVQPGDKTMYDPRGAIEVYAKIKDTTLAQLHALVCAIGYCCEPALICSVHAPDVLLFRANYRELRAIKENIAGRAIERIYNPGMADFMEWIDSLPYQELLEIEEEED